MIFKDDRLIMRNNDCFEFPRVPQKKWAVTKGFSDCIVWDLKKKLFRNVFLKNASPIQLAINVVSYYY